MGAAWNRAHPERARQASREYYRRNAEAKKAEAKRNREELRAAVFRAYGDKCACCGECNPKFLTIDHIVPVGGSRSAYERKALPAWLKAHGYPDGFQVLCWNCNCAKGLYGACPHQK